MLKKSLFFFEEFSYITSFTADRYSQHDPLRLFDLSTLGQIHNVASRVLITGWPSTQRGGNSEEIADTCVWPENGLLVNIETTTATQSQPQMMCRGCNGITEAMGFKVLDPIENLIPSLKCVVIEFPSVSWLKNLERFWFGILLYSHLQHHNDTTTKTDARRKTQEETTQEGRRRKKRSRKTSLTTCLHLSLLQGFERIVQGLRVRGSWRPNINFIFWPHCYDRHVVSFLFSWCWGPLHRGFPMPPRSGVAFPTTSGL